MKFPVLVVLALVFKFSNGLILPIVNFRTCDVKSPHFKECWFQSHKAFFETFGRPLPLIGNVWPGIFEPYRVDRVTIGPGKDQFNVQLVINQAETTGWYKSEFENVTLDLDTPTSHLKGRTPFFRLKGQYQADGKILGKTFKGHGAATITFENVAYEMAFKLEPYKKAAIDFWRVTSSYLTIEPERVRFEFENQPQDLVDEINQRWREVFDDAKDDFTKAVFASFDRMVHLLLEVTPIRVFVSNYVQHVPFNPLRPFGEIPLIPRL